MSRLGAFVALARLALVRVLGVPDYDAYVRHLAAAHPDSMPVSRADFVNERLIARYSRPGARCC